MGKKKKVPEKLRLYYKGAVTPPTKVADEREMDIIRAAFEECLPKRSQTSFNKLRFVVGLKAGLRCLKQKRTKAIIYDNTAADHLTKYLKLFCHKQSIPVIEADRLIDLAPKVKLQTLLLVSLVDNRVNNDIYKEGDPRPKLAPCGDVKSQTFERLYELLFNSSRCQQESQISFKMPEMAQVASTGKSKAKKQSKRQNKPKEVTDRPNDT